MTKKQLSEGWKFWPIFSLGMYHIDVLIDIDIFKMCQYIDNRYCFSIYRTPLLEPQCRQLLHPLAIDWLIDDWAINQTAGEGGKGVFPHSLQLQGRHGMLTMWGWSIFFWKHRTLTGKHCRVKYPGLLDPNDPDKTWEYGECPGACPGHLNQRNKNKFPHIYWQFNLEQCCAFDEDTK